MNETIFQFWATNNQATGIPRVFIGRNVYGHVK